MRVVKSDKASSYVPVRNNDVDVSEAWIPDRGVELAMVGFFK